MGCNFLSTKIKRWFTNDNSGKSEREFSFRFRGKESFQFMQIFPALTLMIFESGVINKELKLRLRPGQMHPTFHPTFFSYVG